MKGTDYDLTRIGTLTDKIIDYFKNGLQFGLPSEVIQVSEYLL